MQRLLADLSDSTMLRPVLIALREVAVVVVDEEVAAASVTEDVVDEAAAEEVAEEDLAIVDEVDPEVAVVQAQTAEALETSKARSRLFKSRGIA